MSTLPLPMLRANAVDMAAPFGWLRAGWSDLRATPLSSLFYGLCFAVAGYLIAYILRDQPQYIAAVWAAIIAWTTAAGLLMGYLGIVLVAPLLGHASWHAYRELVGTQPAHSSRRWTS